MTSPHTDLRFQPALDHLQEELRGIRTGRAAASLVEHVKVEVYGSLLTLRDIASIVVDDAQTLRIEPYDKASVPNIVKAIETSSLGVTPSVSGTVIRLVFPPLTTERRSELVGVIKKSAEEARIAVRNIREHEIKELKQLQLSEDELEAEKKELQKHVDAAQATIGTVAEEKETEIINT